MSEAYVGQIEAFPYIFVPENWALCDGSLVSIAQYDTLFQLIGTTYGGDGVSTFGLPDLRGRAAMGLGSGPNLPPANLATASGEEMHTLVGPEMPVHSHVFNARVNGTAGGTQVPGTSVMLGSSRIAASGADSPMFTGPNALVVMCNTTTGTGGQPHENRMPYLPINYCICLTGIFPPTS